MSQHQINNEQFRGRAERNRKDDDEKEKSWGMEPFLKGSRKKKEVCPRVYGVWCVNETLFKKKKKRVINSIVAGNQ